MTIFEGILFISSWIFTVVGISLVNRMWATTTRDCFAKDKCQEQRKICARMYQRGIKNKVSAKDLKVLIETCDEPKFL